MRGYRKITPFDTSQYLSARIENILRNHFQFIDASASVSKTASRHMWLIQLLHCGQKNT